MVVKGTDGDDDNGGGHRNARYDDRHHYLHLSNCTDSSPSWLSAGPCLDDNDGDGLTAGRVE